MTTVQTIESQDMNLGKLFGDFYVVPNYQREYVWEDAEVEQFSSDTKKKPVYPNSKFLLTRSIGTKVTVGKNTAIDRLYATSNRLISWSTTTIEQRQTLLTELAFDVWEVPKSPRKAA